MLLPNPFVLPAAIISSAITLAFTMPFIGALVRFRANYTPRRVQLAQEEDDSGSPVVDIGSYFGMLKRVHRIEGWAGLYKGIMPSIIESVISVALISPLFAIAVFHPIYVNPPQAVAFFAIVPLFLLIPMQVLKVRVITTPYKLSAFQPNIALRALLSPTERAHPLRLYLLPGVAASVVIPALIIIGVHIAWNVVTMHLGFRHGPWWWSWTWRHAAYRGSSLALLALTTAIITPFQVLLVRLSLQPFQDQAMATGNNSDSEQQPVEHQHLPQEEPTPTTPAVYAAEDVVELRLGAELPPYTSLKDCAECIVREEGKSALFRGWWLTALGLLMIQF
ncbi:mitochondrial carrier [Mycena amicta]|nr:mitochondrial carrier [Mycena amicta]